MWAHQAKNFLKDSAEMKRQLKNYRYNNKSRDDSESLCEKGILPFQERKKCVPNVEAGTYYFGYTALLDKFWKPVNLTKKQKNKKTEQA